jgi:archaellum component FlaG (FlaF/FlaG flagellin family)
MLLKSLLIAGSLAALLTSCNVRNRDTLAVVSKEDSIARVKALSNPTTVQIIDSAYNFGKVTEGEVVEYSYRFKNTGDKPLIVTNATASCGCTVPEKPEQPILPGETGFIKVKFNSENRVGNAHKTITVSSNAEPAFPELSLSGEVLAKPKTN